MTIKSPTYNKKWENLQVIQINANLSYKMALSVNSSLKKNYDLYQEKYISPAKRNTALYYILLGFFQKACPQLIINSLKTRFINKKSFTTNSILRKLLHTKFHKKKIIPPKKNFHKKVKTNWMNVTPLPKVSI